MDHYWERLPGPNWFYGADIYRAYVESAKGPSVAVELGSWKGRSASFMGVEIANSGKKIDFYAIDHWHGSEGESAHSADPDVASGRLYDVFLENIAPVAAYVNPIRSHTALAADQFADESVDFLYVDASHTYEGVLRDLIAWYPKVKIGGTIAGDDWRFKSQGEYGVREAVLDFFGQASATIVLQPGSQPNQDWPQWLLVKAPRLRVTSKPRLAARRLSRPFKRLARHVRAARRAAG